MANNTYPTSATYGRQGEQQPVTNTQMYLAFAAEHLRDAITALETAIQEQPMTLAYLRDTLTDWRQQRAMLDVEVSGYGRE